MNSLLFYQKPVRLNKEEHRFLRFQSSNSYEFASAVNSVPLNGIEFFQTSRHLPVFFSCDSRGDYFPIALLSLKDKTHSLADEAGNWGELYVPAFIRRYPFAMSDDGTICFDETATHFCEDGERLFTDSGEQTDTLTRIVEFVASFDQANHQTRAFCAAAKEQNLFKPFNIQVMVVAGEPLRLNGLFVIDEARFAELPETTVNRWFRAGWLAWVYAHLHSLATLGMLAKRQQPGIADQLEKSKKAEHEAAGKETSQPESTADENA